MTDGKQGGTGEEGETAMQRSLQHTGNRAEGGLKMKARILIVEDEAIVVDELRTTLKRLGYEVPAVAFCGAEAVSLVEEAQPDLVLMNIGFPGKIDGIEAAQKIRERCDIPIVYFTGYMDEEMLQRAKGTAPFSYIMKPYDESELVSAIEKMVLK
jgi:two-component system, cell cycle sensor histidine kinase and response regulator CckA